MALETLVNTGLGNGLFPDDTKPKPLHEPMLTYQLKVLWHSSEDAIIRRSEDTNQ